MGVKCLLPCLRSITRPTQLEQYRGLSAAVDAMSWLHKGIFATDVKTLQKYNWNKVLNLKINLTCIYIVTLWPMMKIQIM
mmetsp:Transcript_49616/g.49992  ORF Transcript_49616/g.49992 Transcript_49616/m.49992 type:complete len:80 (-) Transcript_49616:359-598(-)